jgi:hypothetical protein
MTIPSVPAGYQYTTLTLPAGGWGVESIPYGATPAVVTGDVLMTPLLTSGGYDVTATADGIVSIDANSDTSAQYLVACDIFDTSLDAFYGAADFAINDAPPLGPEPGTTFFFTKNLAVTVDLSLYASDPELGALSTICLDTLPAGLVIVASILSGIPTVEGTTEGLRMRSSDRFSQPADWLADMVVGQITEPDVTGLTFDAAAAVLAEVHLNAIQGAEEYSDTIPAGRVSGQSPPGDTLLDAGASVTLAISKGRASSVQTTLTLRRAGTLRPFLLG